jgi:hypothetical protein
VSGIRIRALLMIAVVTLVLSIAFSYAAVVAQNPHAPTQPLYGPTDFAP